ncbi:hypothetical protein [Halobellus rarus]|uniref:CopG family transcriptional regulator n=1 Tax=Halobellus rarus TaxID=1126237 RepID=A0ABD6CJ18_9EURY|nr:hypothetical protein [Halobellus rarus]
MGSERVDGLPDELESWVDDRAAATDRTREEVVHRLIAAHRELDERGGGDGGTDLAGDEGFETVNDVLREADAESIERELDEIVERVAALEADLDEKITDVRERVIQVKRETDAKAPAEHDHPEIDRRLSEGFENYEEILEYLTDTTDEHGSKLDRLGSAVLAVRSRLSALEGAVETREAAADLRREANSRGVTKAACESCGETVHLGLLDEPRCPHCDAPFDGLEPKRRFFGSNRLTVGDRPALESAAGASGATDEGTSTAPTPDEDPDTDDRTDDPATHDHTDDARADTGANASVPGDNPVDPDRSPSASGTPTRDSEGGRLESEATTPPKPEEQNTHDREPSDPDEEPEGADGEDGRADETGGGPPSDHREVRQ